MLLSELSEIVLNQLNSHGDSEIVLMDDTGEEYFPGDIYTCNGDFAIMDITYNSKVEISYEDD